MKNNTTQYYMCWTPLYASKHKKHKYDMKPPTHNCGKDEPNIVCMRKS